MYTAVDLYELELSIYSEAIADYEKAIAENPALTMFLAKPMPPQRTLRKHWTMKNVVTSSRRKWRHK